MFPLSPTLRIDLGNTLPVTFNSRIEAMFETDLRYKPFFGDTKRDTKSPGQTVFPGMIPLVFRLLVHLVETACLDGGRRQSRRRRQYLL